MNDQEQKAKLIQERRELEAQITPLQSRIVAINKQIQDIELYEWTMERGYPMIPIGAALDSDVIAAELAQRGSDYGWDTESVREFVKDGVLLEGVNPYGGWQDTFYPTVSVSGVAGGGTGGIPYAVAVEAYWKAKERGGEQT